MSFLLASLDAAGLVGFLIATVYAYRNHANMKFATNMWFYFASASMIAAIWSLLVLMREVGFTLPPTAETSVYFGVIFLFTLFSIISYINLIKPLEER
tara:strand:+ start:59 stop:352 length:294 start_codon:yes stop_codon:yes gene_type:complete